MYPRKTTAEDEQRIIACSMSCSILNIPHIRKAIVDNENNRKFRHSVVRFTTTVHWEHLVFVVT